MIRKLLLFVLLLSNGISAQPLQVTRNQRFLQTMDGRPFFWLGDTAWELFHRLDRQEAELYIQKRAEQGFNVIQAVALYELLAFEVPNAYGDFPLAGQDIETLNITPGTAPGDSEAYDYWDHVQWICESIAHAGMYVGLLPCWGEYVTPRKRERTICTVRQGYDYGWFIGHRLKHINDAIVWILGGDRLPDEKENGVAIWRAMAEGITDGVNDETEYDGRAGYEKTFMTYHCYRSSSVWFHEDAWLDMHTYGSYHEKHDNERAFMTAEKDWALCNPKPTLNSEPAYELLPVNYDWAKAGQGCFDDFDVRQTAYWSVFSGACGHTYGCHPVWQMHKRENPNPPLTDTVYKTWFEALDEPGAFHAACLKELMLSFPFESRHPDPGVLVENPHDPTGRLSACSGDGYALVYVPTGKPVKVNTRNLSCDTLKVSWFQPKTGERESIFKIRNEGMHQFDPPGKTQRGNDWVLILEADTRSKSFSSD